MGIAVVRDGPEEVAGRDCGDCGGPVLEVRVYAMGWTGVAREVRAWCGECGTPVC